MGEYLRKARHHAKQIEYYYDYAGQDGYDQAVDNWNKLSELAHSASQSKNDKGDVPLILAIRDSLQQMMDEMETKKKKKKNL
jgi:hypothetical protein